MKIRQIILLSCILSGPSFAQIYELAYADTNGNAVVRAPSAQWFNPNGTITVTQIAGLDRKVKLELLQGTTILSNQSSALLTVANRITASDGQSFYGNKFTLPKPTDGNYILRSTVFDIGGNQVSTNSITFNVDTVSPSVGDISWSMVFGGGTGPGGMPAFSTVEARLIKLTASDALSGLSKGLFKTSFADGRIYATGEAKVVADGVALGDGSVYSVNSSHIPSLPGEQNTITLTAVDTAGNQSSKSLVFWNNSICHVPPPTAVAIQDPDAATSQFLGQVAMTGFTAISGSTPVKVNPSNVIFKVPKVNLRGQVGGELGGSIAANAMSVQQVYDDGTNVFLKVRAAIAPDGTMDWSNSGWTDGATWRCNPISVPSPSFTSVSLPPVLTGYTAYVDGFGWTAPGYRDYRESKPASKISKARVSVEPRSYEQTISATLGSCVIPAGQTTCEFPASYDLFGANSIGGGQFWFTALKTDENSLQSAPRIWDIFYDNQPPVIDQASIVHNAQARTVSFTARELNAGAIWNYVNIASAGLIAVNVGTGEETYIGSSSLITSGEYSNVEAGYSNLPDGNYQLFAYGKDRANNVGRLSFATVTNDGSPPGIGFKYSGADIPSSISNLRDLRILLTDTVDPSPSVTSMTLVGGPINDALQLGFSKQANGWAPEVPRMFPSLEAGQEYTLTVTAKDSQGNSITKNQKFGLTPTNLVSLPDIQAFTIAQSLKDKSDVPLTLVKFKGALTDGQSQSKGNQSGYFTLRSDAAFGVIFNGLTVQPGETKDVVIPLDSTGQASLPIYPATSGKIGRASYMIDIPQLTVN